MSEANAEVQQTLLTAVDTFWLLFCGVAVFHMQIGAPPRTVFQAAWWSSIIATQGTCPGEGAASTHTYYPLPPHGQASPCSRRGPFA
eukprot:scaffold291765_cov35-Tisochrysis_lutea.AAC.6